MAEIPDAAVVKAPAASAEAGRTTDAVRDSDAPAAAKAVSPFYCFAVGIAPAEGAERAALARLEELMQRSRWLVRLRWLAAAGVIAATTVAAYGLGVPLKEGHLYSVAAFLAACNAVFYVLTRRLERPARLARDLPTATVVATLQIVVDLVILAVLIHFSGGAENPFFFYFIFHMIIASILLSRAASLYIATFAVALFSALALGEHFGVLPHYPIWNGSAGLHSDRTFTLGVLVVFASTMYLAVYFAGDIVEKLRARDRELIGAMSSLEKGTLDLHEAYEKIRTLEARKSDFLRTAAHQLRSPLSAIRSLLDIVLDGFASEPERQAAMLQRAHDRTDMMLAMVNELLVLSRLKDAPDAAAPSPERVDACAILAELDGLYRPRSIERKVALALAPPPASCAILASADDVRQVLNNLLDNALNYTPEGGSVTLSTSLGGGIVSISVADTGIGIPEDARAKLFEEFYRAPNAKAAVSHGTGLGLAIVKRTVERWHGTVSFVSAPGRGTTFTVEFPAAGA